MNLPPMLGLYIHIPFCHARCGYCDFVTFTGKERQQDPYIDTLRRELTLQSRLIVKGRAVSTVFLGGGTPSVLAPNQSDRLMNSVRKEFALVSDAEITVEANPESATRERLSAWRKGGANRISFGLQTYDNRLLRSMDRLHSVEQFLDSYRSARSVGFSNISIDLIYGFPGQSLVGWQETVKAVVDLEPEHLSLYALAVEPHTPFAERNVITDADQQADQYAWAREWLPTRGYPQYEISNFARRGFECKHNLLYWRQQDYLGAGVGAVGCVGGLRWQNEKNLNDYLKSVDQGRLPRSSEETLDVQTQRFERLMLGLRLREGLDWEEEEGSDWSRKRDRLCRDGLLERVRPGRWRVSDQAVPILNQVLLPFL